MPAAQQQLQQLEREEQSDEYASWCGTAASRELRRADVAQELLILGKLPADVQAVSGFQPCFKPQLLSTALLQD